MIAVDDIGEFATLAFTHPGKWHGRALDLAGEELAIADIVASFSRVTDREVKYQQVPWDAFEQAAGHEYAIMFKWFEEVGFSADIAALREENSKLTHFEPWLRSHFQQTATATA
jgi:uncharacterized protein YbjT (DUF2867 family)